MKKDLLIFGNGLGRALSQDNFFSLERALNAAWNDDSVLNETQRNLIRRCLPAEVIETDGAPSDEDQLDKLHQILAACDLINEFESETDAGWLSSNGKNFPAAIRSYLHRAACEFHQGSPSLPESFAKPLREHIMATKSHVATLNYDNLLYQNFIGTDVFKGYTCLIDGFLKGKFSPTTLSRHNKTKTSFYLHLHGSPLFHDAEDGNDILKAAIADVNLISGDKSGHIVLTNVKHKIGVIHASSILSAYWKALDEALSEANRIILFGYSGLDAHLNQRIRQHGRDENIDIVVVEYSSSGATTDRTTYWNKEIGPHTLKQCENILEFTDWASPIPHA